MIDNQGKRSRRSRPGPRYCATVTFGHCRCCRRICRLRERSSTAKRTRLPVYVMGLLVSGVIFLILDLDRPSAGFITNNQQPMIDTAAMIAAFPELK